MGRRKKRETPAPVLAHRQAMLYAPVAAVLVLGSVEPWGHGAAQADKEAISSTRRVTLLLPSSPAALTGEFPLLLFWSCTSTVPAQAATRHQLPWPMGTMPQQSPSSLDMDETPTRCKSLLGFCSIHSSSSPEQRQFHIILNDHVQNNKGRLRAQMH